MSRYDVPPFYTFVFTTLNTFTDDEDCDLWCIFSLCYNLIKMLRQREKEIDDVSKRYCDVILCHLVSPSWKLSGDWYTLLPSSDFFLSRSFCVWQHFILVVISIIKLCFLNVGFSWKWNFIILQKMYIIKYKHMNSKICVCLKQT